MFAAKVEITHWWREKEKGGDIGFHLCDLQEIPPQMQGLRGIPPQIPAKSTTNELR
jgi:hypothetical protein